MSTARVRDRFALRCLLLSVLVQSHATGNFYCTYTVNCLLIWSRWEASCFLNCPSDNDCVAGIVGWEVWHMNMSTICNATISQFPSSSLEFPFHHVFSNASSTKHQCPLGCNYCHIFGIMPTSSCIASLCPFNVVEHGHEHAPLIKGFRILPVQVFLNMLLDFKSREAPANELHFWGCQIEWEANPCSFLYVIQFCRPIVGWIWIWDSDTQCRIWEPVNFPPDQFCCWITQQRILDQRNVFQSCNSCMLYASLRSISVFTCRCTDCIKYCVLGKLLFNDIHLRVCVILCQSRWSPYAVARELAPNCNVEHEILKIGRIFAKSCTSTLQCLIVKFVLTLALRLEILDRIVELPDVLFSISVWMKMNFLFTWRIFRSSVATGRPEPDPPVASSCPELQIFTLGVASSLAFWWCCAIVHVGFLIGSVSLSLLSSELAHASR